MHKEHVGSLWSITFLPVKFGVLLEAAGKKSHNAAEMRRPKAMAGNMNRFFPLPCTAGCSSLLVQERN